MADIQYLNYGDLQIELLAFLTKAANEVLKYVQSLPWSNKRKEKFMSAYSDIMSKGITGVSNATGLWLVNVGGNIDLDSKDRKDREMYQEAAYFIQQQMAGLPTKAGQEDETKKKTEEEKSKLPLYNNFKDNFLGFVNKTYFGNNPMRIGSGEEDDWNYLDERDSTGKRGTTHRANRLALYLEEYSKSLEEGKFNFEGSPYTDLTDLKSRINNAITYLKDGKIDLNDKDALNALGLKTSDYFNNGTGDLSGKFNNEGQELTYGQLAEYNAAQAKAKQQLALEQLKAARANQWDRLTFLGAKLNGKPLSAEHSTMEYLLGLASKANLSGDEASELVGAFKLAARTGQLLSLSKEELQKFGRFQGYSNPNRLRKINNLEGVYWDTIGNRIVRPYMSTNAPLTSFLDILDLNNPEKLTLKYLEILNSKKLSEEDWDIIGADITSMLGDIASLGGGYAGAAGGLTTIVSDLYADIRRGKDFWDTAKNLAKNAAWGVAGLIPGVKLARLGKRAALLYALFNSWGIITDDDVHKSWKKLINGEDITSHDFENFKWTLHAVTGAHNTVRSHYSDKAIQNKTLKTTVETKNGTKPITSSLVKEINKTGGRGGQQKALDKFKEITGEEAKPNLFQFNTEGRAWYNPTRYSQKLRNLTSDENILKGQNQSNRITIGRLLVQDKNKPLLANPFKSSTYKGWFTEGGPNRGYYTMALAKSYNNSVPKQNQLSEISTSSETLPTITKFTPENRKNILKAQKEMEQILHPTKSRKAIKTNDKGEANIEANINGEKISINYNSKTNELKINNGTPTKVKDGFEVRQKILSEILERRKLSRINARQNKSKNEFKIDILELRKLKKAGFLKQGGTIDKLKIQKYKEYIKK